jgi:outer membrane lipoprotein-sorting protein
VNIAAKVRAALGCVAAALAIGGTSRAVAFGIDELAQGFARVASSQATFVETKFVSTLNAPLTRRGTLAFRRPDRLEMRVEAPYPETIEIDGDTLTMQTTRGSSQARLSTQPLLAAWVESLRATLAGDTASLSMHFTVVLRGSVRHWTLELAPLDPALRSIVRSIEITGDGAQIAQYEIDEVRGDRTVVVVTPVAASR